MTLWQILDRIWLELGQNPSSPVFSRQNLIYDINSTLSAILKWRVKSLLDPSRVLFSTRLAFNETIFKGKLPISATMTKPLLVWDTDLYFPTGTIWNTWYVTVWGIIFQYTSKTSDKVTLASPSTVALDIMTWVQEVFLLPTDILVPIQMTIKDSVWDIKETIPMIDEDKFFRWYNIIEFWSNLFLIIRYPYENNYFFELTYSKKPVQLNLDSDVCILPDMYPLSVVANIVAWENGIRKGFPQWEQLLNKGYSSLQEMYGFFDAKSKPRRTSIKPISYFR